MSKNTPATVAPAIADVEDPTVDDLAQAEAMAKIEDAAAEKVAKTFSDASDIFTRARTIAGAASRGASLENIAQRVTAIRTRARFPRLSEDELTELLGDAKALRKFKVTVSKSSMQQYDATWRATVDAGVKPTTATIEAMFRVKSTGGHAKPLAALIESLGEAEGDERVQLLVEGLEVVLFDLRHAVKESEGNPGSGSDEGSGDEGDESEGLTEWAGGAGSLTIDGLEGVIRTALVEVGGWSQADRDRAEAAASTLLAVLLGEVEVPEVEVAEVA